MGKTGISPPLFLTLFLSTTEEVRGRRGVVSRRRRSFGSSINRQARSTYARRCRRFDELREGREWRLAASKSAAAAAYKIFRERRLARLAFIHSVWSVRAEQNYISVLLVSPPPQIENDPIRRANLRFEVASLGRSLARYRPRSPDITSAKEGKKEQRSPFLLFCITSTAASADTALV